MSSQQQAHRAQHSQHFAPKSNSRRRLLAAVPKATPNAARPGAARLTERAADAPDSGVVGALDVFGDDAALSVDELADLIATMVSRQKSKPGRAVLRPRQKLLTDAIAPVDGRYLVPDLY